MVFQLFFQWFLLCRHRHARSTTFDERKHGIALSVKSSWHYAQCEKHIDPTNMLNVIWAWNDLSTIFQTNSLRRHPVGSVCLLLRKSASTKPGLWKVCTEHLITPYSRRCKELASHGITAYIMYFACAHDMQRSPPTPVGCSRSQKKGIWRHQLRAIGLVPHPSAPPRFGAVRPVPPVQGAPDVQKKRHLEIAHPPLDGHVAVVMVLNQTQKALKRNKITIFQGFYVFQTWPLFSSLPFDRDPKRKWEAQKQK